MVQVLGDFQEKQVSTVRIQTIAMYAQHHPSLRYKVIVDVLVQILQWVLPVQEKADVGVEVGAANMLIGHRIDHEA